MIISLVVLIPAIDLMDGACVRLRHGEFSSKQTYSGDPVAVARSFAEAGAKRIHLVDLDAARGTGDNTATIRALCAAVDVEVEVGGGIRTIESVAQNLEAGARAVVVGTTLAVDPPLVRHWCDEYPDSVVAAVDVKDGRARVRGWQEGTDLTAIELARRARDVGCTAIEYTNIATDGAFTGPDVAGAEALAAAVDLPVFVSGGVSSLDDIVRVARVASLAGVILGRALYEARFSIEQAVEIANETAPR